MNVMDSLQDRDRCQSSWVWRECGLRCSWMKPPIFVSNESVPPLFGTTTTTQVRPRCCRRRVFKTSESIYIFFFFFFHLTYSRWTSSLPSCLWSQRIFPSLPGSRLTIFLSRCKFSTLTTRQPMVEFYLLTFPRFPLRKKEHKSYFGKNRTHDFRSCRCAAYLLDHSGDERLYIYIY